MTSPDPYRSGPDVCCGACGGAMDLIAHGGRAETAYWIYKCTACQRGWQRTDEGWERFEAKDYGGVA